MESKEYIRIYTYIYVYVLLYYSFGAFFSFLFWSTIHSFDAVADVEMF